MIELINISVTSTYEFMSALRQIDNILRTVTPYLAKNNTRKKDKIKERKARWLIKLRRYLKEKNYYLRYWETSLRRYDEDWNLIIIKHKEANPEEYRLASKEIEYNRQYLIEQYENIKNIQT